MTAGKEAGIVFMSENYLLTTQVAKEIYQEIAFLPIVDFHTHIEVERIAKNQGWADIWEVEAAQDHYVWELMRRCGIHEEKITGPAPKHEKWRALATVFPRLAGSPVYDWLHLDLARWFGIRDALSLKTADRIWQETQEKLATPAFQPRELLKTMGVEVLYTTESPLADLSWHRMVQDEFAQVKVLPSWRPDEAGRIGSREWTEFVQRLGESTHTDTSRFSGFVEALVKTHDRFAAHGCHTSDHGVEEPWGHFVAEGRAVRIYERALAGRAITEAERRDFQAYLLHLFARLDAEKDWTMQLHIGAVRDYRDSLFRQLGPDSGGDVATHTTEISRNLRDFLNAFDGQLRVVLYGLHPAHTYTIATLARAFPGVYVGAPWWFQNNPYHTAAHLQEVAAVDVLSRHAGMVSDSRKLLSIGSRFDMFRRILASVIGQMVEQGRMPIEAACEVAALVAYHNPKALTGNAQVKWGDNGPGAVR